MIVINFKTKLSKNDLNLQLDILLANLYVVEI